MQEIAPYKSSHPISSVTCELYNFSMAWPLSIENLLIVRYNKTNYLHEELVIWYGTELWVNEEAATLQVAAAKAEHIVQFISQWWIAVIRVQWNQWYFHLRKSCTSSSRSFMRIRDKNNLVFLPRYAKSPKSSQAICLNLCQHFKTKLLRELKLWKHKNIMEEQLRKQTLLLLNASLFRIMVSLQKATESFLWANPIQNSSSSSLFSLDRNFAPKCERKWSSNPASVANWCNLSTEIKPCDYNIAYWHFRQGTSGNGMLRTQFLYCSAAAYCNNNSCNTTEYSCV